EPDPHARPMLRSGAPCQAVGEILRQSTRDDLSAGGVDVVRDPPDGDGPVLDGPERVRRARVTVPGLADAPHVHEVAAAVLEIDLHRAREPRGASRAERPYARHMRVPHEAQARRERGERLEAVL